MNEEHMARNGTSASSLRTSYLIGLLFVVVCFIDDVQMEGKRNVKKNLLEMVSMRCVSRLEDVGCRIVTRRCV